jgi:hypothetical protein
MLISRGYPKMQDTFIAINTNMLKYISLMKTDRKKEFKNLAVLCDKAFTRAISDHMCRLMMANFMLGQVL